MKNLAGIFWLMVLFRITGCGIVIPDSVSYFSKRMVYYSKPASWYQAGRLCQSENGTLVHVDGPEVAQQLLELEDSVEGSLSDIHTRMVRHDDRLLYDNDTCQKVNTSSWLWDKAGEEVFDSQRQCVIVHPSLFRWKRRECSHDDEYVCEYPGDGCSLKCQRAPCSFQTKDSISLASVPIHNATMAVCEDTCRKMIGCFATAPSGDAIWPTFINTHCLFIVVGEGTNTMAVLTCPGNQYATNMTAEAKHLFANPSPSETDPSNDPHDCTAPATSQAAAASMTPLAQYLSEASSQIAASCSQVTIYPTTIRETIYVTPTPDVLTAYVTLTSETVTEYVTATPDIETSYITLDPDVQTVFITPSPEVHTVTISVQKNIKEYLTATPEIQTSYVILPPEVQTVFVTPSPEVQTVTIPPKIQTSYVTVSGPLPTVFLTTTVITTATTTAEVTLTSTICPSPTSQSLPVCPSATTTTNDNKINSSSSSTNKTKEEVLQEMSSIVKELTVNPQEVSRTRRQKESAPDDRPSAQTLGFIAGLLLALPPLMVLLMDLPIFFRAVFSRDRRTGEGNAKSEKRSA